MHDSAQQQTFGIYQEMTLLAPDLLSRVMAIPPPPPRGPLVYADAKDKYDAIIAGLSVAFASHDQPSRCLG